MGPETEELVNSIFRSLNDDEADSVDLKRVSESEGVAREPVTTAALLTLGAGVLYKIIPLIDRYLEQRRQKNVLEIIYKAAEENPAAVEALTQVSLKHADVAVSFRPINVAS